MIKPIYPSIWFASNAGDAAKLYTSVFPDSRIVSENYLTALIELAGQKFLLLNGGPEFKPNPSISFFVICKSEMEIDRIWASLNNDGSALMPLGSYGWSKKYGWVQDKYGVNWQLSWNEPDITDQNFVPALMFTGSNSGKAEEAISFYSSLFEGSEVRLVSRYSKQDNDVEGNINHAQFLLGKKLFAAMDSSIMHMFNFTEGVSLVAECDTQEEIDFLWEKLCDGGEEQQCGWLKDKYGVSWQIIPSILSVLMADEKKSKKVIEAFMQMKKFDIKRLLESK